MVDLFAGVNWTAAQFGGSGIVSFEFVSGRAYRIFLFAQAWLITPGLLYLLVTAIGLKAGATNRFLRDCAPQLICSMKLFADPHPIAHFILREFAGYVVASVIKPCSFCSVTRISFGLIPLAIAALLIICAAV